MEVPELTLNREERGRSSSDEEERNMDSSSMMLAELLRWLVSSRS